MASRFWDKLGICASGLCLIHCLLTPVVLFALPTFRMAFLEHEIIHQVFAVVVVGSVLIAVYPQCRKHGHKDIIAFAAVGVLLILLSVFAEEKIGKELEHLLTVLGSISLLTAHIKNIKVRHKKCDVRVDGKGHTHSHGHTHTHTHSH